MAKAQQDQETQANRLQNIAPAYKVGDKVYLSLWNIQTDRPNKKLNARAAKFIIIKVISPSVYRLNTPPGIYNIFNIDLLQPVIDDPLPSQVVDDPQPPIIHVDDTKEWLIEKILGERQWKLPGRGAYIRLEYSVKWVGYIVPTQEPVVALKDIEALNVYLRGREGG